VTTPKNIVQDGLGVPIKYYMYKITNLFVIPSKYEMVRFYQHKMNKNGSSVTSTLILPISPF
jgi:hypothetical protein